MSRLHKIIRLFCRIQSLLLGSCAKETYTCKEPTNRSHPIVGGGGEGWVERQGLMKRKRETERERHTDIHTHTERERGRQRAGERKTKQRQKDKGNSKKIPCCRARSSKSYTHL